MSNKVRCLVQLTNNVRSVEKLMEILPKPWKFGYEVTIGSHRRAVCEAPIDGSMTEENLEQILQEAIAGAGKNPNGEDGEEREAS